MRIAVCLKYVPDPATIEVDPLTGLIDPVRTLYMLNPADGAALEMALRLRSKSDSILALTVGSAEAEVVLRDALSVGVDRVLRLWDDVYTHTQPPLTSMLLATALRLEQPIDLILFGARSVDGGSGNVPALLAEHLDYPVATDITHFEIHGGCARIQRRLARGARAEGEITLPAVLGVEAGLARLRQASLPGLMEGKRAEIPVRNLTDLGLSPHDLGFPAATRREVMPPRPRPRAIFMPDIDLPPHERIAQIVSAGVASKSGQILDKGSPEEKADAIIDFLRKHSFLETAG
jgi:electron transfer flavoprotein beta subunit